MNPFLEQVMLDENISEKLLQFWHRLGRTAKHYKYQIKYNTFANCFLQKNKCKIIKQKIFSTP